MRVRWLWLCAAMAGCTKEEVFPSFEIRPSEIHLPPVAWIDTEREWFTVSILNTTYFSLEITSAQIVATAEGEPAEGEEIVASASDFLELDELDTKAREIPIRSSAKVLLRVTPADESALATWSEADFQAILRLEIGGTGVFDPVTGEPDLEEWQEKVEEIPIYMSTRCDLDGDAYEARECGGNDCDDFLALVNIQANEDCDGFDNNCNGVADEQCPDFDQ